MDSRKTMRFGRVASGVLAAVAFAVALAAGSAAAAPEPRVVTTIAPLHSLAAGVMEGVGTPVLLLKGSASPHDYTLRPSEAAAIHGASIVFWIGPSLEGFMVKTLSSDEVRNSALIASVAVRYAPRRGGVWEHEHGSHRHETEADATMAVDPHVWLDPRNAAAMVATMARDLGDIDKAHAERYAANAAALRGKLTALDRELESTLAPVRGKPFIVFHDGYQYFEKRYQLNGVGSITVDPEQKPSAQRLRALREEARTRGAVCVFAEPQFNDALIGSVVEGSSVRRGTLDPLGATVTPGPEAYFTLMRRLADEMRRCLGDA